MSRKSQSLNMEIINDVQLHAAKNVPLDNYRVENCNYFLKKNKWTNSIKFLYYFCFASLFSLLVYQVIKSVEYYLRKPTYTESHLVRQYDAEFPALSICDGSRGFREDILKVFNIY